MNMTREGFISQSALVRNDEKIGFQTQVVPATAIEPVFCGSNSILRVRFWDNLYIRVITTPLLFAYKYVHDALEKRNISTSKPIWTEVLSFLVICFRQFPHFYLTIMAYILHKYPHISELQSANLSHKLCIRLQYIRPASSSGTFLLCSMQLCAITVIASWVVL